MLPNLDCLKAERRLCSDYFCESWGDGGMGTKLIKEDNRLRTKDLNNGGARIYQFQRMVCDLENRSGGRKSNKVPFIRKAPRD